MRPEWVAVADHSGVVVVPPGAAEDVARAARAAADAERAALARIRDGVDPAEVLPRSGR